MRRLALAVVLVLAVPGAAQQFQRDLSVPPSSGRTEQAEFADVDLDGDWDAGFANGGPFAQQSVLWINLGGAQSGVVGTFADQTATRFPAVLDATRDLEFADYDHDGDADAFLANDGFAAPAPSRFWTNVGGAQAGSTGHFVDETAARWIGLGGAGSSIVPSLLFGGGYLSYTRDGEFGDVDDDGDLDLVHSDGGLQDNDAPTRVFLNDGAGRFAEFNPSGFQLSAVGIANGQPGLWCEGLQSNGTTDATGAQCDVAPGPINVDFGDVDGDLDLDVLLGSHSSRPRLFENRSEVASALAFRDVTGVSFQAGYATGTGHYEELLADLDGDDDLDVYGVNWLGTSGYRDHVARNDGAGYFGELLVMSNSTPDDENAQAIDYDLDGDLDVVVANFAGQERIVRNDGAWSFAHVPTGLLPAEVTTSMDADVADLDADGDYDVVVANDSDQPEWLLRNHGAASDVAAPRVPRVESAPSRLPGPVATRVHCHVYDNAPFEVVARNGAVLQHRVDGGAIWSTQMVFSGAQVFRGEIDGAIEGLVEYRVVAADEHGNSAASAWLAYSSFRAPEPYCFGHGSGTPCPCGNAGATGSGCANSVNPNGANLASLGVPSVALDTFQLVATGMPNSSALFLQGTNEIAVPFGDGLRCVGGSVIRLRTKPIVGGACAYPEAGETSISVRGGCAPGDVLAYQCWYRSAAPYCTPSAFNLSNGVRATWGL